MEAEKEMKRCVDMAMRNQRIIPVQGMQSRVTRGRCSGFGWQSA